MLFDKILPLDERVQQCIKWGEEASKYNKDNEIVKANLGHGYLFSNQPEKAKEMTRDYLNRIDDIMTDYRILDKFGIFSLTDPRIQEMIEWLYKEKEK